VAASVGMATLSIAALPAGARDVPVRDRLLNKLSMGTAWKTAKVTTLATLDYAATCYAHPLSVAKGATTASIKFVQQGNLPELVEQVLVPKGSLNAAYTKVTQALGKCPPTETIGDGTTATFSSLSLPSIGTNTAYQSNITSSDVNESQAIIVAKVGNDILDLGYANSGPLQLTTVENYALIAISRLGG